MVGLGEMYVGACAIFLGAPDSLVALLGTIPVFLGAVVQLVTPIIIDRTGRRKRLFVAGACVQALSWIAMVAAVAVPREVGVWLLLAGFAVYFSAVHFTVPAWMSVMGDLVPPEIRGRYFGARNALAILMQALATAVGGAGLSVYAAHGHEALGFGVVFAGAMLARCLSTYQLSRMWEPPYTQRQEDRFTFWQFVRRLPESNFAKFVFFVASLNAGAHMSGSLMNIYLLRGLKYSYWEFTILTAAVVLVQIPASLFWGRLADRFGNKKVLVATSAVIAALPVMWMASRHVVWALLMQLLGGFAWAGFNQSVGNFLFDAVTPAKRARCTAYMNLLTNTGVLVGGMAGAWLAEHMPDRIGPVALGHAFWGIFILSTVLRLGVLMVFLPRIREVRDVPRISVVGMLFHASREVTEAAIHVMVGLVGKNGDKADRQKVA